MSSIRIAEFLFNNKTHCKGVLSWELQKYPEKSIIRCKTLTCLLTTLFMVRPEKVGLIGDSRIRHWEILPNENGNEVAKCFAARLFDGTLIHMSYKNSVDAYWKNEEIQNE